MIKKKCPPFYFFILSFVLWVQPVYSSNNSSPNDEKKESDKALNQRLSFAGYPVVLYTPETSVIFGVGAVITIRGQTSHAATRPDNLTFYVIYTLKNQVAVTFNPDFYFAEDKWHVKITSWYQKFPDLFFGIGNKTVSDNVEDVTTENVSIQPVLTGHVYKHLRLGIIYHFNHTSMQKVEKNGILYTNVLPGSRGSLLSGLGPIIDWDSRDNIFYPAKGLWFQLYATAYRTGLGSEFDFTAWTMDFRHFFELQDRYILALQLMVKSMSGTIPFNHLALLDLLRGVHSSRFRDRNTLMAQVEFRYPLYKRFSGVAFTSIGDVPHRIDGLQLKEMKYAIGVGLRFAVLPVDKINLRFDVGYSRYGIYPYFQLLEAF